MSAVEPSNPTGEARPLRVALFTDNYGPGHSGLLYAVQFLEGELLARGFRVQVVAPACDGPNPYRDHPHRTELRLPGIPVPGMSLVMATGRGFERALDQLAADPPDVIHVHGLGTIGLLGVWAADRLGVPLMVTWHTDFEAYAEHYALLAPVGDAYIRVLTTATRGMQRPQLKDMQSFFQPRWWRRGRITRRAVLNAAREMLEAADLVTTPSDKTATRCLELAPKSHIRVVPNGADALPTGPDLPAPHGPRILYVGRIAPEKSIGLLVDAFAWLREEIPHAELMIVGNWRTGALLEQKLRRARRRGGVTLVGQVPREKLGPYYASADVFAFPSTTDTQALVLHEAAHAGLPIVSCDHELRLVIDPGVNGAIARPTPESFARQLVMMLSKLEDPAFRERAAERSREMASWWTIEHQSAAMVELYADLAAGRPIEERMTAVPHP
ncbi:glycosyltransferase [Propioniciclava soli]|uniref:Glycosyltransferase n=1 Tax=Propioniciclava soli TaxID=2775081 RepID=A0ABZ3C7E3_9ACTN